MQRKFLLTAFGYAILGLALGIYMAASKDHSQFVTHAHIMLVGFVVSFIYAVCHKLWLAAPSTKLSNIQYYFHQVGTLVLTGGLFLLFGRWVEEPILGPILGVASICVFIALVIMKVMIIKATK